MLLQVASQPMLSPSWTDLRGGSLSHSPSHIWPICVSVGCALGCTESMETRGGAWAYSSQQMSRQVSLGSVGEYQADEQ